MSLPIMWDYPRKGIARRWLDCKVLPRLETVHFKQPRGVMGSYIKLCETVTDAPWPFHEAIFWTVVGTYFGRDVYSEIGAQRVFTNMFTCVVGESGVAHKTTALSIGSELAKLLQIPIVSREITQERLWDILASNPRGCLLTDEFSALLALARKSYGQGLMEMFLQLYDCPPQMHRETKTSGKITIERPYFSILSGSTPDLLRVAFVTTDITGGLVPRFTLCASNLRRALLEDQRVLNRSRLEHIADRVKACGFTEKGQSYLFRICSVARKEWLASVKVVNALCRRDLGESASSIAVRLRLTMVKIAILSAAVAGRQRILEADIQAGMGLVLRMLSAHHLLSRLLMATGEWAQLVTQVEIRVKNEKHVPRRTVLRGLMPVVSLSRLKQVEATLVACDIIRVEEVEAGPKGGRKQVMYHWVGGKGLSDV